MLPSFAGAGEGDALKSPVDLWVVTESDLLWQETDGWSELLRHT